MLLAGCIGFILILFAVIIRLACCSRRAYFTRLGERRTEFNNDLSLKTPGIYKRGGSRLLGNRFGAYYFQDVNEDGNNHGTQKRKKNPQKETKKFFGKSSSGFGFYPNPRNPCIRDGGPEQRIETENGTHPAIQLTSFNRFDSLLRPTACNRSLQAQNQLVLQNNPRHQIVCENHHPFEGDLPFQGVENHSIRQKLQQCGAVQQMIMPSHPALVLQQKQELLTLQQHSHHYHHHHLGHSRMCANAHQCCAEFSQHSYQQPQMLCQHLAPCDMRSSQHTCRQRAIEPHCDIPCCHVNRGGECTASQRQVSTILRLCPNAEEHPLALAPHHSDISDTTLTINSNSNNNNNNVHAVQQMRADRECVFPRMGLLTLNHSPQQILLQQARLANQIRPHPEIQAICPSNEITSTVDSSYYINTLQQQQHQLPISKENANKETKFFTMGKPNKSCRMCGVKNNLYEKRYATLQHPSFSIKPDSQNDV